MSSGEQGILNALRALPQNIYKAPMLEPGVCRGLTDAVVHSASLSRTLTELASCELIAAVLAASGGAAAHTGYIQVAAAIQAARTRLAPPPEPGFDSWNLEYRGEGTHHWSYISNYLTHAEAHRAMQERRASHPLSRYRILGIVSE